MSYFDIDKVARLSRIKIEAHEHDAVAEKLADIVDMLDKLQKVDTSNIKPLANPLELLNIHQPQRQDNVTELDHHEEYQAVAPKTKDGRSTIMSDLYLVPAVIE